MQEHATPPRFTESFSGRLAAFLLLLVWIASMPVATGHLYAKFPLFVGLAGSVCCALWGLVRGFRFPRIPVMAWLSLAMGGYFFWRASTSYSQLEGENVMFLVLGAAIFYVAGIYSGISRKGDAMLFWAVFFGLALNALYWYLRRESDVSMLWWGRPAVGLTGPSSAHSAFFLYKNVASVFFASTGIYLVARCFWHESWSWARALGALLGLGGVALSFYCASRAVYAVLPVVMVLAWLLRLFIRQSSSQHWRIIDWFFLLALVGGIAWLILDFSGEQYVWSHIDSVDTHLRFLIWDYLMKVVPQTPWCGFGAGASQWEIVPYFYEWVSPNYAHNEYLQCWVDFGFLGLLAMLFLLIWHALRAVLGLTNAALSHGRREQIAGALLLLLAVASYAFVDFPWHNFSLLSACAFCCGILAAPRGEEARLMQLFMAQAEQMPPTKQESLMGRGLLVLGMAGALSFLGMMMPRLMPVWKADWTYNELVEKQAPAEEKMRLLEEAVQLYPEVGIVDWYLSLPYPRTVEGYRTMTEMLRPCLKANPKQLFGVVLQADLLGRVACYEEAEALMRDSYVDGGMQRQNLTSWSSYYGLNLMRWGAHLYRNGHWAKAYSVWNYGYRLHRRSSLTFNITWRGTSKHDIEAHKLLQWQRNKSLAKTMSEVSARLKLMEKIGIVPDDSWMEPMRPHGPGPLYQKWGMESPKGLK